jgi:prepilin-type N-terminal cleavage/methylation domain-containing protein
MSKSKGFTLIELLVVIAIIGILSSVVLASLNSARNKGADASVKGNLGGIRAQAELFYDGAGANSYNSLTGTESSCTAAVTTNVLGDSNVKNAIAAATAQKGTGIPLCFASSTAWAVSVPLKGAAGSWFCVSSDGVATTTTNASAISITDPSCL